jgi:long-chain acyl-CoA synthetase
MAEKTPQTWSNLVQMFFDQADALADQPFLWAKFQGAWEPITWRQSAVTVARMSGALKDLGIAAGDRVIILSENRPEWLLADLAIMAIGAISVPAYTTNTERDNLHIIENSGAKAAFVSNAKLARSFLPAAYQAGNIETVIGFDALKIGQASMVRLANWSELIAGSKTTVEDARKGADAYGRDDLACIIYTSGTGGAPRGVMQHHGALLHNLQGGIEIIRSDFPLTPDVFLSFLPLSHAYEHTMGHYFPISMGSQIYYSEGLDKLASNIEETRPTIIVVVPRLFEVLRTRITRNAEKGSWLQRKLFDLTIRYGAKKYETGSLGFFENLIDAYVCEKLVRPKVRERFGGRVKALVSGGAPLNPEIGRFFISLGLTLLQGYGQTEAAPLISCNRPKAGIKMHTVGPPVPHTEVKIAEDGEILVRGELVTKGYWRNEEETKRILQNGWLHTGDIGLIDADGHIQITDRKKDIIVNDKGDNVSPQRVEGMICLEPEIVQAMVYGDKRPYLVGLVAPDPDWLAEWAAAKGKAYKTLDRLKDDPDLQAALQAAVDRVNGKISVVEKVRRVLVASEPFSIENEQMTPSMKIRRHMIKRMYADKLDALYG